MLKAIHKLNDDKSTGRDGIPAEVIKKCRNHINTLSA
jgi:hypothetical protein